MDTDANLTTGDKGRQDKKPLPVKKVQGTGSRSKNSEKYKAKQKIGSSLQAAKKNWRTAQEEKVTEDAMDTEMTETETPTTKCARRNEDMAAASSRRIHHGGLFAKRRGETYGSTHNSGRNWSQ